MYCRSSWALRNKCFIRALQVCSELLNNLNSAIILHDSSPFSSFSRHVKLSYDILQLTSFDVDYAPFRSRCELLFQDFTRNTENKYRHTVPGHNYFSINTFNDSPGIIRVGFCTDSQLPILVESDRLAQLPRSNLGPPNGCT